MRNTVLLLGCLAATHVAPAQSVLVVPAGMSGTPGNAVANLPWMVLPSILGEAVAVTCYDSSNFTGAAIHYPIVISRLRWRADEGTASAWSGGTFDPVTLQLSTAAVDHSALSWAANSNHGADRTTCYRGAVVAAAGSNSPGVPGPYYVAVDLMPEFLYDPARGDLLVDVHMPRSPFVGGTLPGTDASALPTVAASRYSSFGILTLPVTELHTAEVIEIGYEPYSGSAALALTYGLGCNDRHATFYETFASGTFDLGNRTLRLSPAGSGYAVDLLPGGSFRTPTSAPIPLGSRAVSGPHPLGFRLDHPGGSTTQVFLASSGFVWAQQDTDDGCCAGSAAALCAGGARWCPLWAGLDPAAGGSVHFDVDPQNQAAYVTFLGVPEALAPGPSTFQLAFFADGTVEYRYQQCAITASVALTGWSPGGNAADPGETDLSASLPLTTAADEPPLRLVPRARPVTGTIVTVEASAIPSGALFGGLLSSLSRLQPGIDLGAIGMPGCRLLCAPSAHVFFVPQLGTASFAFGVPNDPGLAGVSLFQQVGAFVPGANAFGAVTSNGVELRVGTR